ncbi:MAG: ankyrin repeat domain-containing protein [Legionella sp.]|nr:ankyrin repeat domain-containing protein [Legionella sp.]
MEAPEDYIGPLIYPDDIVGKMVVWVTPGATRIDLDKLQFAAVNYKNHQELAENYTTAIQTSPFVQWTLIPILLGAEIEPLPPIPDSIKNEVKLNKEFFHFLIQQGATYKPYLAGAYGIPKLDVFMSLLELYGAEASIPEKNTINLMQLSLTSHSDHTSFDKVKALILAGADINERIDEEFENTILHYLIALECHTSTVLKLIECIETMPECGFDYLLQDKFGKTPLLLAAGLNNNKVVEQLLKRVLEKNKKNIGLDIPDIEGRTPCMIAAALGHLGILKQLIRAGANCYLKDNQGRGLLEYANISVEEVRSILRSFSVHPDRIASSNQSYLYSSTREALPVVLVEKQTGNEQLVLLSGEEPYFSLLKIALKISLKTPDSELNHDHFRRQTRAFINKRAESILQEKMRNQAETRRHIKEVLFRHACAFGDIGTAQSIGAEENFDFTSRDHLNRTAMHYSVMTKKLVQNLMKSTGYSRNVEDCLKDHPKVFEYLINQNNKLLDIKNLNGSTPEFLLQRDITDGDVDTQEQAQIMLNLLEAHNLSSDLRDFSI